MKSVRTMTMMGTLSIGNWSARKVEKNAVRKAEDAAGAKRGTLTGTKHLLAGNEQLEACTNDATAFRNEWASKTLPWFDAGPRVWAAGKTQDLLMWIGDRTSEYTSKVDAFMKVYKVARENRRFEMGDLFDESEFPTIDVVRSKFYVRFDGPLPLPNADDIRVVDGIDKSELDAMVKEARAREQEKVRSAMREATERLLVVVQRAHEKLAVPIGEKGSIYRDSLFENIAEVVEVMPQFNILGDPALDKLTREAKKLTLYSPYELREDKEKRAKAAAEAKALAGKLTGLFAPAEV